MDIRERILIPAPLTDVWPSLSDPALVAACVPGAELGPDQRDGIWRGSIKLRFGPTVASFRGEATLDFDHAAHQCRIEGRGIDQRGASRALASGTIEAVADRAGTLLTVDGSFTVTGPLETFANAGGVHVARALLAEFSANLARAVEARRPAAAPAAEASAAEAPSSLPQPPPGAAPALSGLGLLWRAFRSWLQDLFTKRKH